MIYKQLFLLLFLVVFSVFSQENNKQFAFRSLTVDDGLSQNSVVSIMQDSTGYMWFATQDGLNKYDGHTFTIYNKQFEDVTRRHYSKLGKVYSDRTSNIWIVSNSGQLEYYNKAIDSFKTIKFKHPVSSVFQDKLNHFYIGTYKNGLFRVDYKTQDTVQVFNNNYNTKTVYDFLETNQGVLVATSKSIINISNNTYTEFSIEKDLSINFSALAQDKDSAIWAGSFGYGLFYKEENKTTFKLFKGFTDNALPPNLNIQDVLVDKRNRLWVATYGAGLYLLDFKLETIRHFIANKENPFALQYNDVLSIYEDYTGTIWFGTDGSGVSYFDEHLVKFNQLTSNQVPENISVDVVRSIAIDSLNNMWLGTSGKGLTRVNIKDKSFKTFTIKNSNLSSNRIMSLLLVDNELWIGHQGQGLQIRNKSGEFKSFSELENQAIWKIYKDKNNQIWLCTRDLGLLKFDKIKGVIENYSSNNSNLTSNNIRTIEAGSNNNLWIGSEDNGLFVLNTQTKTIRKIDHIPYKIKSLCYTDNMLWIGTNGNGLISFNEKTKSVKTYTVEYGLANNVIYAMLPDSKGNLWLTSNKGITRFNPNQKNKHYAENFSQVNGLQAFEFNTGAYYKDKKGQFYFGGINGINWFNPKAITYNQAQPKTVITKFEVFGKKEDIVQNKTLKHNQNTITFNFAGMHFSEPKKNYYKYQLENNDATWTNPAYNNVAHYTNLPPNKYTFKVVSSNYEGVWNNVPTTFSFKILKPWYATNVAWLIYSILLLLSFYTIYRYFKFRWEVKTQLQLEQAETERLKKIDEFKTKLYTNISHEFRTPLTLISGPIDNQLSNKALNDSDRKELGLVKQNANRLLNLVNQMLDLSLIDSGQLKLKIKKGNLNILLKQIIAAFQYKAEANNIKIKSEINRLETSWYDVDVIEKVTSNLLTNALKYAPKGSVISFNANEIDNTLVMAVVNINTSVGKKDLGKLFQRFYQDNTSSDGIGVGLALVKEMVTLSKGSILVNSLDTNKIQFTVTLPVAKEDFFKTDRVLEYTEDAVLNDLEKQIKPAKNQSVLLIVEDDKDIRKFVKSIFSNTYNVIEAANGKEGIDKAILYIPDLIISDIMMPETNGIELCNKLKYNELTSHIPILLLTAKVGEEQEIKGLKTGADAYVTKPFSVEKLKLQVDQLIILRKKLQDKFSQTFKLDSKTIEVSSVEQHFLKRLKSALDMHLTKPDFNAEKLSQEILISRMQLHRKLKAITNLTTTEFLRLERLKLALPLLKNSNYTVAEVAYQVGFNTPSYFIKSFKEVYKCTPNEYASQK